MFGTVWQLNEYIQFYLSVFTQYKSLYNIWTDYCNTIIVAKNSVSLVDKGFNGYIVDIYFSFACIWRECEWRYIFINEYISCCADVFVKYAYERRNASTYLLFLIVFNTLGRIQMYINFYSSLKRPSLWVNVQINLEKQNDLLRLFPNAAHN